MPRCQLRHDRTTPGGLTTGHPPLPGVVEAYPPAAIGNRELWDGADGRSRTGVSCLEGKGPATRPRPHASTRIVPTTFTSTMVESRNDLAALIRQDSNLHPRDQQSRALPLRHGSRVVLRPRPGAHPHHKDRLPGRDHRALSTNRRVVSPPPGDVGEAGLEPASSGPPDRRSYLLSYTPLFSLRRTGRIRTCGLPVPNRTLYQAELQPVVASGREGRNPGCPEPRPTRPEGVAGDGPRPGRSRTFTRGRGGSRTRVPASSACGFPAGRAYHARCARYRPSPPGVTGTSDGSWYLRCGDRTRTGITRVMSPACFRYTTPRCARQSYSFAAYRA